MAVEILYEWGPGESRLALVEDGILTELALDRPELLAGAVILGRVVEAVPRLNATFVDIGQERPGLLDGASGRVQGQDIRVQVRADAWPGKGAILHKAKIDDPALRVAIERAAEKAKAPALLWRPDPLERMLAANPEVAAVWIDDGATFAAARSRFGDRIQHHRSGAVFERHEVAEAVEQALAPTVLLPGGGRISIEPTRALTAIDVDTGRDATDAVNRRAVDEIARQLRLRAIGGQVVIDFVSAAYRGALYKLSDALKRATAFDPVAVHVHGVTHLGLIELVRERRGPSLAELTSETALRPTARAVAHRAMRSVVAEAAHRPGKALTLVVAPAVAAALAAMGEAMAAAESRVGRPVAIRSDNARARDDVMIEEQP
ncbi:MAG: ribonuclease E/G [Magnetospirillum sp.]|nr:ribonuclease E/G [Magnetospirillum sp.]